MIACKPPTSQNFTAKISPNPCYTRMLVHTYAYVCWNEQKRKEARTAVIIHAWSQWKASQVVAVKIRRFTRSDLIFPYRPCNLDTRLELVPPAIFPLRPRLSFSPSPFFPFGSVGRPDAPVECASAVVESGVGFSFNPNLRLSWSRWSAG